MTLYHCATWILSHKLPKIGNIYHFYFPNGCESRHQYTQNTLPTLHGGRSQTSERKFTKRKTFSPHRMVHGHVSFLCIFFFFPARILKTFTESFPHFGPDADRSRKFSRSSSIVKDASGCPCHLYISVRAVNVSLHHITPGLGSPVCP